MKLSPLVSAGIAVIASLYFSHFWFATVQDVLHADWQDVWHLPQPPFAAVSFKFGLLSVFTYFMVFDLLIKNGELIMYN